MSHTPDLTIALGTPPQGKGLLGVVVKENQVLRLDNMQQDSRAIGFPPHHPPMTSMLAAPITTNNRVYGRVYLCDKMDNEPFTDDDELFVTTFANTLAIVNFNLYISRQREQAEEELRLAARVVKNTQEGVVVIDKHGIIDSINPAFSKLTGYKKEEILGQPLSILSASSCTQYDVMWKALNSAGHWQGELTQQKKTGEYFPQWTVIDAVKSHDGKIRQYVSVCTDITERKKDELRLEHMAQHDPLTKLPNRTLFEDRLKTALTTSRRYGQSLAVIFLDLDLFKNINDTLGHTVGDKLLYGVAERLQDSIRECDTVARLGGDGRG